MASTKTIGHMQEFNPASETVSAYLERFELFVTANAIVDEKRVLTLLTVVGLAHYSLLRGLVSPDLPKDKSFSELVDILKKHYDPEPIVIAKRFRFFLNAVRAPESQLATTLQISDGLPVVASSAIFCKKHCVTV